MPLLSRAATQLAKPAELLKPVTLERSLTPVRLPPPPKPAAGIIAAEKSQFTPAAALNKKVVLGASLPQLNAPLGTPSFRVPQGIVPSLLDGIAPKSKAAAKLGAFDSSAQVNAAVPEQNELQLTTEVAQAQEAYDDAVEAKAEAEARLAADLAAYGGVLTDEERQAYIDAFWARDENKSTVDAVNQAADALSQVLEENGPRLQALAAEGNPDAAYALQSGYEALATSDTHADEAVAYAEWLNQNPAAIDILEAQYGEDIQERVGNEILAQALPRAQSEIFNQHPDDPAAAAQAFDQLVAGFETGKEFKDLAQDIDKLRTQFQALARGDYEALKDGLPTGDSPFQQALKLVQVAQGVVDGVHKLENGEPIGAVQDFLSAAKGGLEQSSGLLELLGRTDLAKKAADFSAKLTPFLNVVVDGAQLAEDIQDLFNDGANAGEVISALGSGVSVVGDLLWFTPAGPVLQTLGAVLSGVGGLVEGIIEGDEENEKLAQERRELLEAAGITDDDTLDLLSTHPRQAEQLSHLGLSSSQIIDELERTTRGDNGAYLQQGYQLAALYGLEGREALEFAHLIENLPPELADLYLVPSLELAVSQTDWSNPDSGEVRQAQQNLLDSLTELLGEETVERFGLDDARPSEANADYLESYTNAHSQRPS